MDLGGRGFNKIILIVIGQEVTRPVRSIHNPHLFVFLKKMGSPLPSRYILLFGLECNCGRRDHCQPATTALLQKSLDESTGPLAYVRRIEFLRGLEILKKISDSENFQNLEIGPREGMIDAYGFGEFFIFFLSID